MIRVKELDHLIPIGHFAQQSRLSLKALRLYDRLGLLRPARVDLESGYRFYTEDQLGRARRIALLRRLAMPLGTIQQLLDVPAPEALRLLERYWDEIEERTAQARRIVAYLKVILEGGELMDHAVQVRTAPARQALSIVGEVYVKDLPGFIGESFGALFAHITAQGGETDGHGMVIYHGEVNDDSNGPVEVAVPVARGSVRAGETTQMIELPAGQEAYTTITLAQCRFPEILKGYDAVAGWLKRHGHAMAGHPREIYFADDATTGPDDPYCDIAWPFSTGA